MPRILSYHTATYVQHTIHYQCHALLIQRKMDMNVTKVPLPEHKAVYDAACHETCHRTFNFASSTKSAAKAMHVQADGHETIREVFGEESKKNWHAEGIGLGRRDVAWNAVASEPVER